MHLVQTRMVLTVPPRLVLKFCRFGFQRRLVRIWEWLTDMPTPVVLAHTKQLEAILVLLSKSR